MNKIIYILFVTIIPILGFSGTIVNKLNLSDSVLYFSIILWIITIISLIFYSYYIQKHLEKIGDLKITLSGITKSIETFITTYEIRKIREINIKKHIRNIFYSKNGYRDKTLLVKIIHENNVKGEIIVISGNSMDKPMVDFATAINNLNKHLSVKIKVTK